MSNMGYGIAAGLRELNAGLESRKDDELRQMQVETARMNLSRLKEAEAERQGMKQGAQEAYRRSLKPVTEQYAGEGGQAGEDGQALDDPEFGLEAAYGKEGVNGATGAGLRRNLKDMTGETRFDEAAYQDEFLKLVAEKQPERMQEVMAARKQMQEEGFADAVKLLLRGDVSGAEQSFNGTGQNRIDVGSLDYDAKAGTVTWAQDGKKQTVPLQHLAALAGVNLGKGGEWKSAGDGVLFHSQTGETRGGGAGGPGGLKPGVYRKPDGSTIAHNDLFRVYKHDQKVYDDVELSMMDPVVAEKLRAKQADAMPWAEWAMKKYQIDVTGQGKKPAQNLGQMTPAQHWQAWSDEFREMNKDRLKGMSEEEQYKAAAGAYQMKFGREAPAYDDGGGFFSPAHAGGDIQSDTQHYKQAMQRRDENTQKAQAKGKANETVARVLQYDRGQKHYTNYNNDAQVLADIKNVWEYLDAGQKDQLMPIYLKLGGDKAPAQGAAGGLKATQ